ncbi:4-phosphoerythronate dehydrogenase [bacterium SCSIO 12696]|nr:4-phosphoerythronate dehydrogenase [bacterium SCSIO 12696]
MKIIADENMPLVRELFSPYGEVITVPGRNLSAAQVRDADVLLVRSVTQVNRTLLANSGIRFVGSATIGVDHVDLDYLVEQGIEFSAAPGCNATAVVDYVCAALCTLNVDWQTLCAGQTSVGIVGCGNVGGRLYRRFRAMGVSVHCYDPFLDIEENPDLTDLETVLGCSVVCLHTPHTVDGPFPTHHMLSEAELEQFAPGTVLLNAGRGAAIDNSALLNRLNRGADLKVVLDVWEGEPDVSQPLLEAVILATPHIAGYSVQGKTNGTTMVRDAFLRWREEPANPVVEQDEPMVLSAKVLNEAVQGAYDIREDDRRMRAQLAMADSAHQFDRLRKEYPQRHEFHRYRVVGDKLSAFDRQVLTAFGFG